MCIRDSISVWFIGGAILTAVGVIGEYIGKIYKEVKRRPRYLIEKEGKFTHTKTTIISKFLPRHLEKNHTRGGHTSQQTATYVTAFWTI